MKLFIFGFTGALITYLLCKRLRNKGGSNDWSDVFVTWLFTIFSWVGLIVYAISFGVMMFYEWLEAKKFKNKPSKWM